MFKHILVPTDGSSLSEKAIRRAIAFARRIDARITTLHVLPRSHDSAENDEASSPRLAQADRHLSFAQRVARSAGVECELAQAHGDHPYEEIIRTAQKRGCDLILMASHGRRGIEGFLLGSQTQKVLTHSRTPVLVYR
jgi:nucleotide-binding universal stress UspA family protein